MDAAEIVMSKIDTNGSLEVLQFAGEADAQPRESAKLSSHREILPFDETGRNVFRVGITDSDFGYNLREAWWGVPRIGSIELPEIAKQLAQLREVHVATKRCFDRFPIERKGISSQLNFPAIQPVSEIADEFVGLLAGTLTDQKRGNQFGVCIERDVNPLITKFDGIAFSDVPLFFHQERPKFVRLNTSTGQVLHALVPEFFALPSGHDEQTHDGIPIQARDTLSAPNRAAFQETADRLNGKLRARKTRVSRQFHVRFAEGRFTGKAAPSLNPALTEVPKPFAGLVLASNTGHIGLVFLAGQADNLFEADMRLAPRVGWPRFSVSAESGAYSGLAGTTRFELAFHELTARCFAIKLRPRKGGIQRLAPSDALSSSTHCWWASKSHRSSPFTWIGHIKLIRDAKTVLQHFQLLLQCEEIGQRRRFGSRLQLWRRLKDFLLSLALERIEFIRISHALEGRVNAGKGIVVILKLISQIFKLASHLNRRKRAFSTPEHKANCIAEAKTVDIPRLLENQRSERRQCIVELRLAKGKRLLFCFYLLHFVVSPNERINVRLIAFREFKLRRFCSFVI